MLGRLVEAGKKVSLLRDEPEIPHDVANIYEAFLTLRNSTTGDAPIALVDKVAAWEVFGREDFPTFSRFIAVMDGKFLEMQRAEMEKKTKAGKGSKGKKAAAPVRSSKTPVGRRK